MIVYRCDRCLKETSVVWVIRADILGISPEAQFVPPRNFDLCGDCAVAMDRFREGFAVEAARKRD